MKIPCAFSAAALAIMQKSQASAFQVSNPAVVSHAKGSSNSHSVTSMRDQSVALLAKASRDSEGEDFGDYLGADKNPEAGMAFFDIVNDNMQSLTKRLHRGLNPDTRFFQGNTILHLIALKGRGHSLDNEKYLNIIKELAMTGADFHAKNDSGFTALDFSENLHCTEFSGKIKRVQRAGVRVSVKHQVINEQLSIFSLQRMPTANGKKRIVDLVKVGADTEYINSDGRKTIHSINENWSSELRKAFAQLVDAAKLKSECNGREKIPNRVYVNDQWINALMAFYKADMTKTQGR